ncbi:unnamed protein product [Durusdinium trenchii]|uniref:Zn(2)-C6 fungal-type domain-containing protein n=1 Tax=Durusdinium trenchii TaxID=1381693 RepID=A0ABP0KMM0_9DINO
MEHQTGDDQSFTDLLEACTDGFLKRQKTALSSGGMTTHGREPRERNSSSSVSKPVRMPAIGTVSNALCPPCSGDCSRSGLQCDDNRPCQRFVRDRTFYEEVYMLWLAPWAQTCQEYRIPLPNLHTLQQATLAKLISTHFD